MSGRSRRSVRRICGFPFQSTLALTGQSSSGSILRLGLGKRLLKVLDTNAIITELREKGSITRDTRLQG